MAGETIYIQGETPVTRYVKVSPQPIAGAGDLSYVHNQTAAATHITVAHNLGKYPAIQAYDSAGTRVFGTVSSESVNSFEIDFGALPFSGTVRCN